MPYPFETMGSTEWFFPILSWVGWGEQWGKPTDFSSLYPHETMTKIQCKFSHHLPWAPWDNEESSMFFPHSIMRVGGGRRGGWGGCQCEKLNEFVIIIHHTPYILISPFPHPWENKEISMRVFSIVSPHPTSMREWGKLNGGTMEKVNDFSSFSLQTLTPTRQWGKIIRISLLSPLPPIHTPIR